MKLSKKQQLAIDMMASRKNIYLTGYAGTGKTTVLKRYIADTEKSGKNVLVCATTGMAADNLGYGAGTLHRVLGISTRPEEYIKRIKYRNKLLRTADILVIDEISMCRSDLFSYVGKMIEYENNRRADDRILGGGSEMDDLQVILCGDFFQLPPVMTAADRELLIDLYGQEYESGGDNEYGYAYHSEYWQRLELHGICLTDIYRQQDSSYLYVLSDIRTGNNARKIIDYLEDNQALRMISDAPFLVARNSEADKINNNFLKRLDPETETVIRADITGKLTPSDIKNVSFAAEDLTLNIDARVMVTVNDPDGRYVNGTIGTITDININEDSIDEDYVTIETTAGKKIRVYQYTRDVERQVVEEVTEKDKECPENVQIVRKIVRKRIGSYSQIPLKLAWAISIHKSQGQTFSKINIDPRCWEIGQFYTAVSRARSVEGIHFCRQLMGYYIKPFPEKEQKILEDSLAELL